MEFYSLPKNMIKRMSKSLDSLCGKELVETTTDSLKTASTSDIQNQQKQQVIWLEIRLQTNWNCCFNS